MPNPHLKTNMKLQSKWGGEAQRPFSNRIKDVSFSWDEILNFTEKPAPMYSTPMPEPAACLKAEESGVNAEELEFDSSLLN